MAPCLNEVLDPDNRSPISSEHRDVMLDLILTRADLDGALGLLLSHHSDMSIEEVADKFGSTSASSKFAEMLRHIPDTPENKELKQDLKRHKRKYEELSVPRNRIAHGRCGGALKSHRDHLVFSVLSLKGVGGPCLDAVSVDDMRQATVWGQDFMKTCIQPYIDETAAR